MATNRKAIIRPHRSKSNRHISHKQKRAFITLVGISSREWLWSKIFLQITKTRLRNKKYLKFSMRSLQLPKENVYFYDQILKVLGVDRKISSPSYKLIHVMFDWIEPVRSCVHKGFTFQHVSFLYQFIVTVVSWHNWKSAAIYSH